MAEERDNVYSDSDQQDDAKKGVEYNRTDAAKEEKKAAEAAKEAEKATERLLRSLFRRLREIGARIRKFVRDSIYRPVASRIRRRANVPEEQVENEKDDKSDEKTEEKKQQSKEQSKEENKENSKEESKQKKGPEKDSEERNQDDSKSSKDRQNRQEDQKEQKEQEEERKEDSRTEKQQKDEIQKKKDEAQQQKAESKKLEPKPKRNWKDLMFHIVARRGLGKEGYAMALQAAEKEQKMQEATVKQALEQAKAKATKEEEKPIKVTTEDKAKKPEQKEKQDPKQEKNEFDKIASLHDLFSNTRTGKDGKPVAKSEAELAQIDQYLKAFTKRLEITLKEKNRGEAVSVTYERNPKIQTIRFDIAKGDDSGKFLGEKNLSVTMDRLLNVDDTVHGGGIKEQQNAEPLMVSETLGKYVAAELANDFREVYNTKTKSGFNLASKNVLRKTLESEIGKAIYQSMGQARSMKQSEQWRQLFNADAFYDNARIKIDNVAYRVKVSEKALGEMTLQPETPNGHEIKIPASIGEHIMSAQKAKYLEQYLANLEQKYQTFEDKTKGDALKYMDAIAKVQGELAFIERREAERNPSLEAEDLAKIKAGHDKNTTQDREQIRKAFGRIQNIRRDDCSDWSLRKLQDVAQEINQQEQAKTLDECLDEFVKQGHGEEIGKPDPERGDGHEDRGDHNERGDGPNQPEEENERE